MLNLPHLCRLKSPRCSTFVLTNVFLWDWMGLKTPQKPKFSFVLRLLLQRVGKLSHLLSQPLSFTLTLTLRCGGKVLHSVRTVGEDLFPHINERWCGSISAKNKTKRPRQKKKTLPEGEMERNVRKERDLRAKTERGNVWGTSLFYLKPTLYCWSPRWLSPMFYV